MEIDLERLARDRGYWDEVALEDATHYATESKCFMHRNDFGRWFRPTLSVWMPCDVSQERMIPRPTQTNRHQKSTSGDNWHERGELPEVGVECEISFVSLTMEKYWQKATVVARRAGLAVVESSGGYFGVESKRLRPLPTQQDIEREELRKIAVAYSDFADEIADATQSAGFHK